MVARIGGKAGRGLTGRTRGNIAMSKALRGGTGFDVTSMKCATKETRHAWSGLATWNGVLRAGACV